MRNKKGKTFRFNSTRKVSSDPLDDNESVVFSYIKNKTFLSTQTSVLAGCTK